MKRFLSIWLLPVMIATAADLPVREVILYKNGVGYFARSGDVKAGDAARLEFNASEMNDVLKSLSVGDKSGGKVIGVRYDSSEPLEAKLAEFPFRLDPDASLASVFAQLKGARVELRYASDTVAGSIVGARRVAADKEHPDNEYLVLLTDSGELRNLYLPAATSIRLADPKLQDQLKRYLGAVDQARSKDKRSVTIESTATGARSVWASYLTPTAVWKSSYRLLFTGKEPVLEGWAIVDNTSGEDWTNIKLALVSGRPVSFISQLYPAKFRERPTVELPEDRVAGPVIYQGGVGGAVSSAAAPAPPAAAPMMARKSSREMAADAVEFAPPRPTEFAATAAGREAGELFEYRFGTPITVKRGESTMLPFVQDKVAARRLLIYDGSTENPMAAAEITNGTGKTLDGGPITVFDADSYAGEALMETLKGGDKRLISFAVDLGTRVTTAFQSDRNVVREIHVARGVLTTKVAGVETRTYTIRNVDQRAKTLIIQHGQRAQYRVLNQKPMETTANAYRFEVNVGAGATVTYPVTEERVYDTSTAVASMTPDVLMTYVQNRVLSDTARRQLEVVAAKKKEIADTNSEVRRVEKQVSDLTQDQSRIRQNIDSLNRVSGQTEQVQKYAKQLATQESTLAGLRDRQGELSRKVATLEAELNGLIEKLEF